MTELENKLWRRVERYGRFLQIVPFVKMVAVCNNLAFGKVDERSDIDLFVVAKSGRLFFVRTFVTVLLHLFGVRRHGNKIAGRFCLSFFVDEEALNLEKIALQNDIYLAFWIKSMKPVIEDGEFFEHFLKENLWVESFFEKDLKNDSSKKLENLSFWKKVFSTIFGGRFGDFVEKKLKNWQLKRAGEKSKHVSAEGDLIINEHMLKFHNIDRRKRYQDAWRKQFGDKKLTYEDFLDLKLDF